MCGVLAFQKGFIRKLPGSYIYSPLLYDCVSAGTLSKAAKKETEFQRNVPEIFFEIFNPFNWLA